MATGSLSNIFMLAIKIGSCRLALVLKYITTDAMVLVASMPLEYVGSFEFYRVSI
ncbi:hypothetical protein M758_2G244600 [Ceratodon purpureus]|uniref:Uncharacterized protein n=1 Tax=Ceratodon purpureus TaxID=3225 RepID=A0A8T0J2K5_CERPU|nr:hypothetical protein KC19_2G291600 [Ceratodon purpureus]KAG0628022.1 hypothetical protein M758_2G244600 [Ceratodon purpureus]